VFIVKLKYHLRKADQVVQVPGGLKAGAFAAKNAGKHLLGSGFPVTSCHPDNRDIESTAMKGRNVSKGTKSVFYNYAGQAGGHLMVVEPCLLNEGSCSSALCSQREKVVTVKVRTIQRYKELP
jgi:hypothetical protein